MDPAQISAMKEMPEPKTIKELQTLTDSIVTLRRFIPQSFGPQALDHLWTFSLKSQKPKKSPKQVDTEEITRKTRTGRQYIQSSDLKIWSWKLTF